MCSAGGKRQQRNLLVRSLTLRAQECGGGRGESALDGRGASAGGEKPPGRLPFGGTTRSHKVMSCKAQEPFYHRLVRPNVWRSEISDVIILSMTAT